MAGWSDWYSGAMAPPLKVPGGYIPAPSIQAPMSVEDMYQGIIPSAPTSTGLTTRTVRTVPVPISVSGSAEFGVGAGVRNSGSTDYRGPKTFLPNAAPGPNPVPKWEDRLPATPAGLPLKSDVPGFASARGALGAGGFGAGDVTAVPRLPSAPVHQLNIDPPDEEGQMYADSMGLPVRSKSGKVYTPKVAGSAVMPSGAIAPRFGGTRAPAASPQRSGGLFGALFGGGSGGGLFGGGNPQSSGIGTSPSQGKAMVVSPGTSSGSVLESMGFSSGGLVPAVTVRGLEDRGYFR